MRWAEILFSVGAVIVAVHGFIDVDGQRRSGFEQRACGGVEVHRDGVQLGACEIGRVEVAPWQRLQPQG